MWGWLLSGVNEGPSLQDSNGIWLKVRLHPCQGLYWYTGAREERRGGGIQQGITLWGASSRPWQTGRHKMGGREFTVLNAGSKFHISTKKFWNIQCSCIYSCIYSLVTHQGNFSSNLSWHIETGSQSVADFEVGANFPLGHETLFDQCSMCPTLALFTSLHFLLGSIYHSVTSNVDTLSESCDNCL